MSGVSFTNQKHPVDMSRIHFDSHYGWGNASLPGINQRLAPGAQPNPTINADFYESVPIRHQESAASVAQRKRMINSMADQQFAALTRKNPTAGDCNCRRKHTLKVIGFMILTILAIGFGYFIAMHPGSKR